MSTNYRKSFNFRSGVQVDNDNFIVNPNGLVGIGTSVPTELFDLRGNAKIVGLVTASNLAVSGVSTFYSDVKIGSGILFNPSTGAVNATSFYGDGSTLSNIVGYSTEAWIINSSKTGISTSLNVGIGTTNPQYSLQIGEDPLFGGEGISFDAATGNINSTGGIAATSFTGELNASNLTGTISNSILPTNISVGIVTATSFYGDLVGTASTANSIGTTANISINSINSGFSTSGISTVYTTLHIPGNIGVGTLNPNSQIHVRKSGISSIQLTSDGSNSSTITFGRSVIISSSSNNAQLRFGNTSISYPDSTQQSLDIINYDTGNLNFYLNPGGSGAGSFNWFKSGISKIMTLTGTGNLGINSSSPTSKLSVNGDCYLSGIVTVGTALSVSGTFTVDSIGINTATITNKLVVTNGKIGVKNNFPTYDLQVGDNPQSLDGVGISTNGSILCSNSITCDSVVGCTTVSSINVFGTKIGIGTNVINESIDIDAQNATSLFAEVGIRTTNITIGVSLDVVGVSSFIGGDVYVGIDTSTGVILTSPNGTKYRLTVSNGGTLSTVLVP